MGIGALSGFKRRYLKPCYSIYGAAQHQNKHLCDHHSATNDRAQWTSRLKRIGIIAALPAEAKCLYKGRLEVATPIAIGAGLFLCLSGMGDEAAYNSGKRLIDLDVQALISWGVAGALHHSVHSGDLLIAQSIMTQQVHYATTKHWSENIQTYCKQISQPYQTAAMTSINTVCASVQGKQDLFKKTEAMAVDMESGAVARVAKRYHKDLLVIRAIADEATMTIPPAAIKHTDILGQPQLPAFLISCAKNPSQLYHLGKLAWHYKNGLKTLQGIAPHFKKLHFLYNS